MYSYTQPDGPPHNQALQHQLQYDYFSAESVCPATLTENAEAPRTCDNPGTSRRQKRKSVIIAHPYSRMQILAEEDRRTRFTWDHELENEIFSEDDLANTSCEARRKPYLASLHRYIDTLHEGLERNGVLAARPRSLRSFITPGKLALRAMLVGLQQDAGTFELKRAALQYSIDQLEAYLNRDVNTPQSA